VPELILKRYVENFAYFAKFLFSTRQLSADEIEQRVDDGDIYGFKKSLVGLSSFGKIFSLSSFDGSIQWVSNFVVSGSTYPSKIFVKKSFDRQSEVESSQIVAVYPNKVVLLDSNSGNEIETIDTTSNGGSKFMLINLNDD